jgi:thiamine-monophosphate kinase
MNEIKFLKALEKNIPTKKDVIKGIGDDTAVLPFSKDKYLLYASDMIVEGVHFKKDDAPQNIGYKAVAVNISDIAAMAGTPKYITVSAGIPKSRSSSYRNAIFKGIKKVCKSFNVQIVGGDTCASEKLVLDVSIIGEVKKNQVVYRSGAKVGDQIYVTGVLGDAQEKQFSFIPRVKLVQLLSKTVNINAMMDISDGLFMDIHRLCSASKKGCQLYREKIPVSKKARSFKDACTYGEDFEILFTLSSKEAKSLEKYILKNKKIKVYNIGEITNAQKGVCLIDKAGKSKKIKPIGYEHF